MKLTQWMLFSLLLAFWLPAQVAAQIVLPDFYLEDDGFDDDFDEGLMTEPGDPDAADETSAADDEEDEPEMDAEMRQMMQRMNFAVQRGMQVQPQVPDRRDQSTLVRRVQDRLIDGPEMLTLFYDEKEIQLPNQTLHIETVSGIVLVRLHRVQHLTLAENGEGEDDAHQLLFDLDSGDRVQGRLFRPMFYLEAENRLIELDTARLVDGPIKLNP